jgi:hypothetical protein
MTCVPYLAVGQFFPTSPLFPPSHPLAKKFSTHSPWLVVAVAQGGGLAACLRGGAARAARVTGLCGDMVVQEGGCAAGVATDGSQGGDGRSSRPVKGRARPAKGRARTGSRRARHRATCGRARTGASGRVWAWVLDWTTGCSIRRRGRSIRRRAGSI